MSEKETRYVYHGFNNLEKVWITGESKNLLYERKYFKDTHIREERDLHKTRKEAILKCVPDSIRRLKYLKRKKEKELRDIVKEIEKAEKVLRKAKEK